MSKCPARIFDVVANVFANVSPLTTLDIPRRKTINHQGYVTRLF